MAFRGKCSRQSLQPRFLFCVHPLWRTLLAINRLLWYHCGGDLLRAGLLVLTSSLYSIGQKWVYTLYRSTFEVERLLQAALRHTTDIISAFGDHPISPATCPSLVLTLRLTGWEVQTEMTFAPDKCACLAVRFVPPRSPCTHCFVQGQPLSVVRIVKDPGALLTSTSGSLKPKHAKTRGALRRLLHYPSDPSKHCCQASRRQQCVPV